MHPLNHFVIRRLTPLNNFFCLNYKAHHVDFLIDNKCITKVFIRIPPGTCMAFIEIVFKQVVYA